MVRRERNTQGIVMVILVVLLLLAVGYIVFGKYVAWNQATQLGNFQQGAQYGYTQAFIQIVGTLEAQPCQGLPLMANNKTINVISVDCLAQAQ